LTKNKFEDEEDTCAWNMPRMTPSGPVAQVTTLEIWKQKKKKKKGKYPPPYNIFIHIKHSRLFLDPFDAKEGPPSPTLPLPLSQYTYIGIWIESFFRLLASFPFPFLSLSL